LRILVVDSDPIQRQSLERGLKGRGHSIITAASLNEAISVLADRGEHVHLILTDLKSPHLDAFELTRKARIYNRLFPVIIMTTYISSELQKKALQESGIALIEKPFVLEQLIREVERLQFTKKSTCSF